jgi:hypothetical protein
MLELSVFEQARIHRLQQLSQAKAISATAAPAALSGNSEKHVEEQSLPKRSQRAEHSGPKSKDAGRAISATVKAGGG